MFRLDFSLASGARHVIVCQPDPMTKSSVQVTLATAIAGACGEWSGRRQRMLEAIEPVLKSCHPSV